MKESYHRDRSGLGDLLERSVVRLFKGIAGSWLLVVCILPYRLTPSSLGAFLSASLFIAITWLVLWDYKKGATKIYPFARDGLILLIVAGLSGAVLGFLSGIFGDKFSFPWWVSPIIALPWFALLEGRKASAQAFVSFSDQAKPPFAPQESSSPPELPSGREPRGSYVARHWRGDLSLPVSYWINGPLVTFAVLILLKAFLWDDFLNKSPKLLSTAAVAVWALVALITLWQLVGIWRSANNYISHGKSRFWGNTAKVAVVLGLVSTVSNYISTGIPQIIEYTKIAVGKDPVGTYQLRILRDATELEVSGAIAFELTDDIRRTLDAHPTIQIIHLNSYGGRVGEARKLRELISSRGLTTFTATSCESACLLAYVAGQERLIAKNANLGFHQYSFPGMKSSDFKADYEKDKQDWLDRGFDRAFVNKAFAISNNEMWKPTHPELFQAGVVTGYPGGDDVAVSGIRPKDVENLEAKLLKNPLFAILKTHERKVYDRILSGLKAGVLKGRSLTELQRELFPLTESAYMKRLPYASDFALRSFAKLMLEEMEVLYSLDPALCYGFLFPDDPDRVFNLDQYFSKELREREFAVLAEVIRSASQQANHPPKEEQIQEQLTGVYTDLLQRYGDDMQMLDDPVLAEGNKAKICQITYDLYQTILRLPNKQSGPLLRFMFASAE